MGRALFRTAWGAAGTAPKLAVGDGLVGGGCLKVDPMRNELRNHSVGDKSADFRSLKGRADPSDLTSTITTGSPDPTRRGDMVTGRQAFETMYGEAKHCGQLGERHRLADWRTILHGHIKPLSFLVVV